MKQTALIKKLLLVFIFLLLGVKLALAQLQSSPWPMFHHDFKHTGRSRYIGPATDSLKWEIELGWHIFSSPAIDKNGIIYIGCCDGCLYAVADSGTYGSLIEPTYCINNGGIMYSSPAIGVDGTVYIGSDCYGLHAVDSLGVSKWIYLSDYGVYSSPTISPDGTIYLTANDDNLHAIEDSGTYANLKWTYPVGQQAYYYSSSPAIDDNGTIYVGSGDVNLYAIEDSITYGNLKWSFAAGDDIYSSPSIGTDGTIYVGCLDNNLYAIDQNGDLKWSYPTGDDIWSSPAIGIDGTIYVGSDDGKLYAIEDLINNGNLKWTYQTGNEIHTAPAVDAQGTIYVTSTGGFLYAIEDSITYGNLKWSREVWAVESSPAIGANGTIYVGNPGGYLCAIGQSEISFAPAVNYETGNGTSSVFCADLDGDLDLAIATNYDDVSILKNNGDGTFQAPVNYSAGLNAEPFSIFCADLDSDGDLDVAVAAYYKVVILWNNGDGTFGDLVSYGEGFNHFYSIFCADLDNDMDIDLAMADPHGLNAVLIMENNGDGTFEFDGAPFYSAGSEPWSVFCADLDGDGNLDLAVANLASNDVSIFRNNGDGTFGDPVNYATGDNPRSVFCVDLDGDGDLDLGVANFGSDNVSILKNNGDGTFKSAVNYGAGDGSTSVFCTDLNGDGDFDLAVANWFSDNISILENNGNGTFDSAINYETGNTPRSVFSADLDGDGDFDLAVANGGSDNVSILKNLTQVPANQPPNPFSLVSPADSSSVFEEVTMDWETTHDPNLGDQIIHDLYISTSIGFHPDSTIIDSNLILSQHTDTLDPGTYYWRVKAKDNWGAETWSTQTWSFGSYVGIDETEPGLNKEFYLSQNYPNPSGSTTNIEYTLPTDCKVKLEVYNVLGEKITTLVNQPQNAGHYRIQWKTSVTSGIYFLRIEAGEFSKIQKMVIME